MRYVEDETHRQSIIRKLNHMQRDVLDKYHKKTKRSILQNEIIQKTDGWEFIDIKVGENYRDNTKSKDERLYCQCGAELKYQYQLLDKQSGELIGLGETCFEHYTGISSEVAEQIKKEQLELDEWLDDILLNVEEQQYLKVKTPARSSSSASSTVQNWESMGRSSLLKIRFPSKIPGRWSCSWGRCPPSDAAASPRICR